VGGQRLRAQLSTGQVVGGAIGLAALGTVAWTAVASSVRTQAARAGHRTIASAHASIYHNALAVGIARGFLVAAGIALGALVITVIAIRIRREDLAGAAAGRPVSAEPAMEQARS
jgi:hypothetical protein